MSKMEFAPSIKKSIPILFLLFIIGCAEIGHPPGGEIDKVKPRIIDSSPANGSTMVKPDNNITITFSERIIKPTSKRSLYISPRLKSEAKIKWKSDKVIISLPDSFAVDQTYIISFAEGVTDLRRNPLDSGSIIAFTTGESLAEGIIKGSVVDISNNPQDNIVAALYKKTELADEFIIDSLYPSYMGITNTDGSFSFNYIPDGEYLLLVFADRNKNDRLDSELELYGMSDRTIIIDPTQKVLKNFHLTITVHKESALSITSVRQTNDNLFQIDLNQFISTKIERQFNKISFYNYEDSSIIYNPEFILRSDSTYSNSIAAYFATLNEGLYKLKFQLGPDDSLIIFDSIKVKEFNDKNNPQILVFNPDNLKVFKDSVEIFIQFSEPIDSSYISSETFYLLDDDSSLIFVDFEFINPSLCQLSTDFLVNDIYMYRLHISEFDLIDFSGNKMGDSTTIQTINLINEDSLGVIRGEITQSPLFESTHNVNLIFHNLETNQIFKQQIINNSFQNLLPQGRYFLSGFLDINNNNKRDFGSVSSMQFAEPFVHYGDTIKIRARFETTDILLEFK